MAKIMEIISKETGGKSYNTEKYSYDTIGMPSFDYDDDGEKFIKWQVSGETEKHKTYVDLTSMAKQDNYKKERAVSVLSFHFSDFGMRGYISMMKPSGLFLRFSFSFW